jgi:hypothetical protein
MSSAPLRSPRSHSCLRTTACERLHVTLACGQLRIGFLPVETFLAQCLEGMHAQHAKDATMLDSLWRGWVDEAGEVRSRPQPFHTQGSTPSPPYPPLP